MNELRVQNRHGEELQAEKSGLDTLLFVYDSYGNASIELDWVQAQQLFRWLKERLGE